MKSKTKLNGWVIAGQTADVETSIPYVVSTQSVYKDDETDGSVLEEISRKVNILSTDLDFSIYPEWKKYLDIHDIGDEKTWKFIKSGNYELFEPLWLFLEGIKNFLKRNQKLYRLTLHLENVPEEPNFDLLIISVETVLKNFDEKMALITKIGEIIDNITFELLILKGETFNERLAPIIYDVGAIS